MTAREEQIRLNGLLINYAVEGSGPPLIFLHNGGGFWQSWIHQIQHFKKTHTVYALDWPGFGESESPEGLLSLELLTDTLDAFISAKNLEKVSIVGNCIGGSTALNYSQQNPERVDKLIIMNICPGDLIFPNRFFRKNIPALNKRSKMKRIAKAILAFTFTKTPVKRRFPPILFGNKPDRNSALFKKYVEKFKEDRQTESRVNLLFSVHTYGLKGLLAGAEPRKHILIWGKENSVTSWEDHGLYHCGILQPEETILIDNAGHLCMYEKPDLVNHTIEKYLRLEY